MLSFELSSNFGFFHWSKTKGDRRMTNLFISRTEVLGILGAVIGLEGYVQQNVRKKLKKKTKNEQKPFYELLNGLDIAIIPKKKPHFFEDHLIHRSMKHINSKGPLQVMMTGLINPTYKIVLSQGEVEDEIYEKIKFYLENEWCEFVPYFGKNQFPLEISNFQKEGVHVDMNEDNVVLDSLFNQKDVVDTSRIFKSKLSKQEFHFSESLKNFDADNLPNVVNEQVFWSSLGVTLNKDIYKTNDGERVVFL